MKTAAVLVTKISGRGTPLSREVGESQWKTTQSRGANGMVKARVAPTIELLEDVARDPRPTSLEALPWRHLFALSHFLEGVQGRCLRQDPRQGVARNQALPFPSVGRSEGLSPLRGGKLAREDLSPSREKVAYQRRQVTYPAGQGLRARGKRILLGSPCHPPETRMGDAWRKPSAEDLQMTSLPR
jgi:hypothetical protein